MFYFYLIVKKIWYIALIFKYICPEMKNKYYTKIRTYILHVEILSINERFTSENFEIVCPGV